jgi:hypothetical protein
MTVLFTMPPEKEDAAGRAAPAATSATTSATTAATASGVTSGVPTSAEIEVAVPAAPVPDRAPPPLVAFGAEDFRTALKIGDGTWRWEKGRIGVYSWSYGNPGVQVFGPEGSGGVLEARMRLPSGGDHQGLAFCFADPGNDCLATGAWEVRYSRGRLELADHIGTGGTVVASSRPTAIPIGDAYVVRLRVVDGRGVTAELNEERVITYLAATSRRGRLALVGANGEFAFENVRYAVEDPGAPGAR